MQDILSFDNLKGIWNADICKTSITAIWNCVSFKISEMKVKTPFKSEYMKLFCFPSRNRITGTQMKLATWGMGNDFWECGSTKCKMVYQRNTPTLTPQYYVCSFRLSIKVKLHCVLSICPTITFYLHFSQIWIYCFHSFCLHCQL